MYFRWNPPGIPVHNKNSSGFHLILVHFPLEFQFFQVDFFIYFFKFAFQWNLNPYTIIPGSTLMHFSYKSFFQLVQHTYFCHSSPSRWKPVMYAHELIIAITGFPKCGKISQKFPRFLNSALCSYCKNSSFPSNFYFWNNTYCVT